MNIYSSLCKPDTMEPFGAQIGLALSSATACLVQPADHGPTVRVPGLSGRWAQHHGTSSVVDQDKEKLKVLQPLGG